jgi:hypothetical protein
MWRFVEMTDSTSKYKVQAQAAFIYAARLAGMVAVQEGVAKGRDKLSPSLSYTKSWKLHEY